MFIILSIPDDTSVMTVTTNSSSKVYEIDSIHYMRDLFLRNVPAGENFDRKYRILKEQVTPVETLNLPVRIVRILLKAGISSVQTLLKYNRNSLLKVDGLSDAIVNKIADRLIEKGYDAHELNFPGISVDEIEAARLNPDSVLNLTIDRHLANRLYRAGVKNVQDLKELSSDDLLRIPGFQFSDFSSIVTALEENSTRRH